MTIDEIKKLLPHRYPFLFVDLVREMTDEKIIAQKNCTINEPFFQGHFPDYPIMPGVLQVEGLAQVAGIFLKNKYKEELDKSIVPLFLGIDKARFKREIRPSDVLIYEVKLEEKRETIYFVSGKITCREKLCTKARLMLGFK
ncbi:MAG: 3-hydroxyacyl-ACP dehydratase FabZ [Thermotogota bacterium]|nr:3-hydroxyacyl-ACP dehydratase FabZ [Thermotogota bacterium]